MGDRFQPQLFRNPVDVSGMKPTQTPPFQKGIQPNPLQDIDNMVESVTKKTQNNIKHIYHNIILLYIYIILY